MDLASLTISQPAAWPPAAASEPSTTDAESVGTSFDAVLQTSIGEAGAAESAPAIVAPAPDEPAAGAVAPPPAVVVAVPAAPVPTAPVPVAPVPTVPVAAVPVAAAPVPAAPMPAVSVPTSPVAAVPGPTAPAAASPATTAPVPTPVIAVPAQRPDRVALVAAAAPGRGVATAANVTANGVLQRTSSSYTPYTGREGPVTPEHNPLGAGVRRDDDRDVARVALQNAAQQMGITYDASDLDDVIRHAWYDTNVNTSIGTVINWYLNTKYAFRAGNIPGAGGVDPSSVSEPSQMWSSGASPWMTAGAAGQKLPASEGPLSPLGEQVKAFLQQGPAGLRNAAWRPVSALDLGIAPGAAPGPGAPADRAVPVAPAAPAPSDKAQAMARAIVRTTVEGLALGSASGADAAATPDTPAPTVPVGSSDALATTPAPQALGVNAVFARHEARAAYRSEQAAGIAGDAPVLSPVAAAADAFLNQQPSHGGQGDSPRPDTARHAPEGMLATFALPALGATDPATLAGVSGTGPAAASAGTATMTELPRQILRSIQVQVRDGVSEARLRLSPEHLGEVTVRVRVESGGVTAILHAESPQVSGWIAAHQDELRSALGEQGLQLDHFTVTTDPEGRRRAQEDAPRPRPKAPRARGDAKRFEVTF